MTVDTSGTLEIHGSPWKLLSLAVLGAGMTLLAAAIAFDLLPGLRSDSVVKILVGWVGLVFFGACTAMILARATMTKVPLVTMSPMGLLDTRVARHPIPWSAVRGISTWSHQGQRVMVVAVDPAAEAQLELTAIARWTRKANLALGADGLCVASQGLRMGYDEMLAAAIAYAAAYAPGTTPAT